MSKPRGAKRPRTDDIQYYLQEEFREKEPAGTRLEGKDLKEVVKGAARHWYAFTNEFEHHIKQYGIESIIDVMEELCKAKRGHQDVMSPKGADIPTGAISARDTTKPSKKTGGSSLIPPISDDELMEDLSNASPSKKPTTGKAPRGGKAAQK